MLKHTLHLARAYLVALAFAAFATDSGCAHPIGAGVSKVINCASAAIQDGFSKILPAVNSCVAGSDESYEPCLVGLIGQGGEDLLACVLRDQGTKFLDSARANPKDAVSVRSAAHAQAFMAKRGYRFAVEPQ